MSVKIAPSPCRKCDDLEARFDADLLESRVTVWAVALVEEEQVAYALVVGREAGDRVRDRCPHARVTGDEDVRPPVPVHICDGRSGVPAVRGVERLGPEGAVAVVPEDVDTRRRGDDEVGVAVAVQVGRDAARALDPDTGVRGVADVHEPAVDVLEECALRQSAVALPDGHVRVGVGVDDEEAEPAAVVVVDPADAAAHHRLRVVAHRVAERVLTEVESRASVRRSRA